MRAYLDGLREKGVLVEVRESVSVKYEVASIMNRAQHAPMLFRKVRGYEAEVAGNLCTTKARLAEVLKVPEGELYNSIRKAMEDPLPVKRRPYEPDHWDLNPDVDLRKLPILTHYRGEAGPCITAGVVAARFPDARVENLSIHRMRVLGAREVVARVVPRHLSQIASERGGEVDVAVSIGVSPTVFLATALQPPYRVSEYDVANALLGGELALMECEGVEASVPADAEIVLEGRLSMKRTAAEGPFVDLTGTYDEVRRQPTIRFVRMHLRQKPIYHAVVGAAAEHTLFMGVPQELKVWEYVKRAVPQVRGVNFTPGGCGYFHCVVSLEKATDGDGKTTILNCFAASHGLKLVIAVDNDIDPFDLNAVEWALATRFQAETGLIVVSGARGSTLDPSSAKKGVTAKLGLDATLPVGRSREAYRRGEIVATARIDRIVETLGLTAAGPRLG